MSSQENNSEFTHESETGSSTESTETGVVSKPKGSSNKKIIVTACLVGVVGLVGFYGLKVSHKAPRRAPAQVSHPALVHPATVQPATVHSSSPVKSPEVEAPVLVPSVAGSAPSSASTSVGIHSADPLAGMAGLSSIPSAPSSAFLPAAPALEPSVAVAPSPVLTGVPASALVGAATAEAASAPAPAPAPALVPAPLVASASSASPAHSVSVVSDPLAALNSSAQVPSAPSAADLLKPNATPVTGGQGEVHSATPVLPTVQAPVGPEAAVAVSSPGMSADLATSVGQALTNSLRPIQRKLDSMDHRLTALEQGRRLAPVRPVHSVTRAPAHSGPIRHEAKPKSNENRIEILSSSTAVVSPASAPVVLVKPRVAPSPAIAAPTEKPVTVADQKTSCNLNAVLAGRAWLKNSDGSFSTYGVGDKLPDGQLISGISQEQGVLVKGSPWKCK